MLTRFHALFGILLIIAVSGSVRAQSNPQRIRISVLDFGLTRTGLSAAGHLWNALLKRDDLLMTDREETRAAAKGAGYEGSLNMTLQEARDLGGAIGCEFYITGEAQTLRRSPSTNPEYFEAYASIFIVSARTGRLITWDRTSFEAASRDAAEKSLLGGLPARIELYIQAIRNAQEKERGGRAQALQRAPGALSVIEDAPEDETTASRLKIRLPQPYRRLRPSYPESAARAEAEATVDVQLELDERGEVTRAEIVRWAGFGLDEAALDTVRQLHFSPARREGAAVPMRVLLRYNFRRPARETRR